MCVEDINSKWWLWSFLNHQNVTCSLWRFGIWWTNKQREKTMKKPLTQKRKIQIKCGIQIMEKSDIIVMSTMDKWKLVPHNSIQIISSQLHMEWFYGFTWVSGKVMIWAGFDWIGHVLNRNWAGLSIWSGNHVDDINFPIMSRIAHYRVPNCPNAAVKVWWRRANGLELFLSNICASQILFWPNGHKFPQTHS